MFTTGLQNPKPKNWKNVKVQNDLLHAYCFYCRAFISSWAIAPGVKGDYSNKDAVCGYCWGTEIVEIEDDPCNRCDLSDQARFQRMKGRGSETPRILVVGEAPGKQEDNAGMPFIGSAGGLLTDLIKEAGIPDEWVRYTHVVRCCPHDGRSTRTPTTNEMSACKHYIEREICEYKPELVIAVGAVASQSLIGKKTITKIRGCFYPLEILHLGKKPYAGVFQVLPIIHPSAVLHGNEKYRDLIYLDLLYAKRYLTGEGPKTIQFRPLDTIDLVEKYVEETIRDHQEGKFDCISVDIETSSEGKRGGLDLFHPTFRILCLTICRAKLDEVIAEDELDTVFVPYLHRESEFAADLLGRSRINYALTKLFQAIPIVGQNFQFDHAAQLASTDIRIPRGQVIHDTMLAAWVLTNDTEPHDLDYLATKHTEYIHPKERMRAEQSKLSKDQDLFEDVPYDVFQEYACGDVITVAHLVPVQRKMLAEAGIDKSIFSGERAWKLLTIFQELSMKSHDPAVEMRMNGIFINQQLLKEVEKREDAQLKDYYQWFVDKGYEQALKDQYDYKLVLGGWQSMNLLFHGVMALPYIVEHCKEAGPDNWIAKRGFSNYQGSTDQETIKLHVSYLKKCREKDSGNAEYYALTIEALETLLKYRTLNKHFTSYVRPLTDFIGKDGCVHSNFGIRTTGTSRWTAYDPPLQTVPFMSQVKRVYRSRFERGLIVAGDYSQMELREAARISGDPVMLEIFNLGQDIHRATAAKILGKSLEDVTAHERRKAKATNFGILFGATPWTIAEQNNIPEKEAEEFVNAWLATFSKIRDYMKLCEKFARKNGCIYTPLGARRLLPDIHNSNERMRQHAIRQSMNTPIQGQSSDWATFVLQGISRRIGEEGLHSKLWAFIHDSIEADAPVYELWDYMTIQLEEMTTNLVNRFPILTVPLKVDFEVGLNWGEMVDAEILPDRRIILSAKIDDDDKPEGVQWLERIMTVVGGEDVEVTHLLDEHSVSFLMQFPELTYDRVPSYTPLSTIKGDDDE